MRTTLLALILFLGGVSMCAAESTPANTAKATFAGGCFWCMEPPFEKLPGVFSVVSGYTGGAELDPTYNEVSSGSTGHAEAIEITYDPKQVAYEELLDIFWMNIDPTTPNRQFADVGPQYRTAIFYHTKEQRQLAEASKQKLADSKKFNKPLVTEIVAATPFYTAEEYHQDYYKKNPIHYKTYRYGSGRESFIQKTWGKTKKGK